VRILHCSVFSSLQFSLSRARFHERSHAASDVQPQQSVETWVSTSHQPDTCVCVSHSPILSPLPQLYESCATSSHLCLQFPPPISFDPQPIQSCIDKLKVAQGGEQDAIIALMELSLCDIRKLSATEMEKIWEASICSRFLCCSLIV
jgi:hypothetical protein